MYNSAKFTKGYPTMYNVNPVITTSEMLFFVPFCSHSHPQSVAFLGRELGLNEKVDLSLSESKYDIIIDTNFLDVSKLSEYRHRLNKEGICVVPLPFSTEEEIKLLLSLVSSFRIVMPYGWYNGERYDMALFLSDSIHPTADLILHRADFIEAEFYNADIHRSCFCLPNSWTKALKGLIKN